MPSNRPHRRIALARAVAAALIAAPVCWLVAGTLTDATGTQGATPTSNFLNDPDRLVFITAHWRDRAELVRIASHFQHVQIDEKAHTAKVEANYDDLRALRRAGVRFEIDDEATAKMRDVEAELAMATETKLHYKGLRTAESIPNYACYRTVEETYATMNRLAAQRPSMASVIDIGPSWTWTKTAGAQGYRMRVLRVNNTATDAKFLNKQNMVVLAAIHAREYTTAELVTRFSEWLLDRYGVDQEATWLVDNFRFHFILQANPDGRKKAESGISWRKNTNTDNGACSANNYGVDLNRNWSWRWGQVPDGSSSNPCAVNYRGTRTASEPETTAAMRYIVGTRGSDGVYRGGVLPDQRTDNGAAPTGYPGIFLDIHSFSRLVLWPWSSTSAVSPNAGALQTLGRRLAYFNNYQPKQWIGLYPADGTNTDTVYGLTGAPSYTIELGQAFFESCSTFESTTYPQNLAALKYAARTLGAPYWYPRGPDTTGISRSAASVKRGTYFTVSAWVDDTRFNQSQGAEPVQNITEARLYLDSRPWVAGNTSFVMRPGDGAFNSPREHVYLSIPTGNLALGTHYAFVRGLDASGAGGTPQAVYFTVTQ
ncbi:hypothetical protein LK996_12135 [Lysobacter sp. A6]|uniref:Peptidase M14 domain-containing protein n=1 Tax=Noviluteimonas lactosilytica TaxID=2888523 RepID=A0ABS8JJQ0_9GAMM|nr:M14 family zinc carboxypeptidase [Lysobacter lactosilyticus]MCC8363822.1 hypothetical protein [Lysobacter lactosilyticus]